MEIDVVFVMQYFFFSMMAYHVVDIASLLWNEIDILLHLKNSHNLVDADLMHQDDIQRQET